MVELKNEGVLISNIKFPARSYAMIGESNWRPKTRPKNNLRLNMKNILNPMLAKAEITVIEDSSSQEDLKEDEGMNYEQVNSKREDSVTMKSSLVKDTVVEQSKESNIKEYKSQKVPIIVIEKHEEDDEAIFKKLNIPWLLE